VICNAKELAAVCNRSQLHPRRVSPACSNKNFSFGNAALVKNARLAWGTFQDGGGGNFTMKSKLFVLRFWSAAQVALIRLGNLAHALAWACQKRATRANLAVLSTITARR